MTNRFVLLPGMDGTGELFQPFVEALPSDSGVAVVSYPPDQALGYEELQAYVLDAAPDGPYVLVAESFSGPLAIAHAASRPSNLKALVLCATFTANPLPRALRWIRHFPLGLAFKASPPKAIIRALLTGRDCHPQLVDAVLAGTHFVRPSVMAHRLAQVLGLEDSGLLASVEVPVLYLAGSKDRIVGLRGLKQVSRHLPGLQSVILDGPHLLLQCRPKHAVREVSRFLAQCREPKPMNKPERESEAGTSAIRSVLASAVVLWGLPAVMLCGVAVSRLTDSSFLFALGICLPTFAVLGVLVWLGRRANSKTEAGASLPPDDQDRI